MNHLTASLDQEWARISSQGDENSFNNSVTASDRDREHTFSLVTQLEMQLLKVSNLLFLHMHVISFAYVDLPLLLSLFL